MGALIETSQKLCKGWHLCQSCHEKRHLDVCGWVGFLAWCFIGRNLTLFEMQNKSFILYAFISKNWHRHEQDSKEIFLFVFCFSLDLEYYSYVFVFNIPYSSIAQYLENVCWQRSPSLVKNSGTYTKEEHE